MYYVMRAFAPSLHRKSTDFLICRLHCHGVSWCVIVFMCFECVYISFNQNRNQVMQLVVAHY